VCPPSPASPSWPAKITILHDLFAARKLILSGMPHAHALRAVAVESLTSRLSTNEGSARLVPHFTLLDKGHPCGVSLDPICPSVFKLCLLSPRTSMFSCCWHSNCIFGAQSLESPTVIAPQLDPAFQQEPLVAAITTTYYLSRRRHKLTGCENDKLWILLEHSHARSSSIQFSEP